MSRFDQAVLVKTFYLVFRLDSGDTHRGADISHERIIKINPFVWHQMVRCAMHSVQLVDDKVSSIFSTVLL